MSRSSQLERRVRVVLIFGVLSVILLYLGQVAFIHLRLHFMDATPVQLDLQYERCDGRNCSAEWRLTPARKFLLLGHLMRTHTLADAKSDEVLYPVSHVRGTPTDSWNGLRVYSVQPGKSYRLVATKPEAVELGYFIGIRPRATDNEGVLSIPDISPTVATLATMIGYGILSVLLLAAFVAPKTGLAAARRRDELFTIATSVFACAIVTSISTGIVDSLIPDGEIRSRILRTAAVIAIVLFPSTQLISTRIKSRLVAMFLSISLVAAIINLNWETFRAGSVWIATYGTIVVGLSIFLFTRNFRIAAAIVLIALYDPLFMSGWVAIPDFPPIYLLQTMYIASFSLIVADLGAVSVIALAARAYHRFTRDISLAQMSDILGQRELGVLDGLPGAIKSTLPGIANLTGAGRVTILINLPFARPIIHTYSINDQVVVTHDDGRIPGAVTVRAFVYGDEAWFERYSDFSGRLNIPMSPHLEGVEYVCIAPIRVNNTNMGVLMLTCFDDHQVEQSIQNGGIEDDRETGRMIVETLASSFSKTVIHSMESNTTISSDLMTLLREAIPASNSTEEFQSRFCDSIYRVTGLRAMLHIRVGESGVGVAQSGFSERHWQLFEDSPFNLNPSSQKAYGSTVVAFKEQKSSYMKDWTEIEDKLHPKTVLILRDIDAKSFLAVPLASGKDQYVVTLVSSSGDAPRDPGLINILESTEAIFDAAITVFNQRTSVLALGKLANRLIGDDSVRDQIIEAAKSEILPTTIGAPRTSFLLLFDLIGSSLLSSDTEERARSYGQFYDEINIAVRVHLGGKIRKTIGDAVIATWDGTNSHLEGREFLLRDLMFVVNRADELALEVGCRGVRAVLHHGDYFFGLIGTSSFGQIDVIGKGIDEVCKLETLAKIKLVNHQNLKIAISSAAVDRLAGITPSEYEQFGFQIIDSNEGSNGLARGCTTLIDLVVSTAS